MGIKGLDNKISNVELQEANKRQHPGEFQDGFEESSSMGDWDDIFNDSSFGKSDGGGESFDSMFSSPSTLGTPAGTNGQNNASPFGQQSTFGTPQNQSPFGTPQSGGIGQPQNNPFGTPQNNPFGVTPLGGQPQLGMNGLNGQQMQPPKEDSLDKIMDAATRGGMSVAHMLSEVAKSTVVRTADDMGYFSSNCIKSGAIVFGVAGVLRIVEAIVGAGTNFTVLTNSLMLSGAIIAPIGVLGIGASAIAITSGNKSMGFKTEDLPDAATNEFESATDDYEDSIAGIYDELFDFGDSDDFSSIEPVEEPVSGTFEMSAEDLPEINFDEKLKDIDEKQVLSRKKLVDTMMTLLPPCNPKFAEKVEMKDTSDDFIQLSALCQKAIKNTMNANAEFKNGEGILEKAYETLFGYEMRITRVRGNDKLEAIAGEIESYLISEDEEEDTIRQTATVTKEGDYYKIIVSKGVAPIVTLGDALKKKEVYEFFTNPKNTLPFISGVTDLGTIYKEDATKFESMLIAGRSRSGKSWYLNSICAAMAMFNSPEDIQLIIVDPKDSTLLGALSLLPHSCGFHDGYEILDILDVLIEKEEPRRKKLLKDNGCENIGALRAKGVKVPYILLIIDEYITVKNNLGDKAKDLNDKLQVILSKLPSVGIRILIVPHRAQGIVDKTNRTLFQFSAAVRAIEEVVKETLGIQKWTRALGAPGDTALMTTSRSGAKYVRGVVIADTDEKTVTVIRTIAKAFYKMGVDMPDMSSLGFVNNRNEDDIREKLLNDGERIQYSADTVFDDL